MNSKFLMITTAIVALGVAPAVLAEGTTKAGTQTTMSGKAADATKTKAATQKTAMTDKTMSKAKDVSLKSKDMRATRAQNAQEVEMTRMLNRDSVAGRQVSQTNGDMSSTPMQSQGAMLPSQENTKGVAGPGNQGDNPSSSK